MSAQLSIQRNALRGALAVALFAAAGCEATVVQRVARLQFVSAPALIEAGAPFTVSVELIGPDGARAIGEVRQVTLALLVPGTVVLDGTKSVTTVDGVATFSDLSISALAADLRFVARTGSLSVGSATFVVSSGPASPDESTLSPVPGNVPPNVDVPFVFAFKDSRGFPVANVPVSVSTTIPAGDFTPPAGTTNELGEFSTVFRATAEGTGTISALVDDVPIPAASSYTVVELCPNILPLSFPGSVDGTQPCGAYAEGVRAASLYEFTTAGGGAAFTITSTFVPQFQVKLAPASNDVLFEFPVAPVTVEWLLPAGTYLFRVSSGGGAGTFNLTGASVSANTGDDDRALVTGGTYTGQQLAAGDKVLADDGSYYDAFYFRSSLACTVTLRSSAFRPYLIIVDELTRQRVAPDVTTPIGVDAVTQLPSCNAPSNRALLIVANSFSAGQTGAYTLVLDVAQPAPVRAGAIRSAPPLIDSKQGVSSLRRVTLRKRN